jgi:hypothetical protein
VTQVPGDARDGRDRGGDACVHVELRGAGDEERADDDDDEEAERLRLAAERIPQRM